MKKAKLLTAAAALGLALSSGAIAQEAAATNLGPAVIGASQQGDGPFGMTGEVMLGAAFGVLVVSYLIAADAIEDPDLTAPPPLPGAPGHWDGPTQHHTGI